jgi:cell division septum initiation protein DivIVA
MSWYNNENQGFIDATQILEGGGSGGGGASQTELNEINEDLTELKQVFIPKQLNTENVSYDTIIVNNTANARIFIKNQNTTPKIKIEGGKLYLYYDADITNAPTITSGWIDVDNYITAMKDTLIGLGIDVIAVNTYLFSPSTIPPTPATLAGSFAMRDAQILQLQVDSLGHEANINLLDERLDDVTLDATYAVEEVNKLEDRVSVLELNAQQAYDEDVMFSGEALQNARQDLQNQSVTFAEDIITNPNVSALSIINSAGQSSTYAASIAQSVQNIAVVATLSSTAYAQYILTTLGGLGLLGGLIYLWLDGTKEAELQKLETKTNLAIEKLSKVSSADIAQNIHKEGLLIIESTNNNLFFVKLCDSKEETIIGVLLLNSFSSI